MSEFALVKKLFFLSWFSPPILFKFSNYIHIKKTAVSLISYYSFAYDSNKSNDSNGLKYSISLFSLSNGTSPITCDNSLFTSSIKSICTYFFSIFIQLYIEKRAHKKCINSYILMSELLCTFISIYTHESVSGFLRKIKRQYSLKIIFPGLYPSGNSSCCAF